MRRAFSSSVHSLSSRERLEKQEIKSKLTDSEACTGPFSSSRTRLDIFPGHGEQIMQERLKQCGHEQTQLFSLRQRQLREKEHN